MSETMASSFLEISLTDVFMPAIALQSVCRSEILLLSTRKVDITSAMEELSDTLVNALYNKVFLSSSRAWPSTGNASFTVMHVSSTLITCKWFLNHSRASFTNYIRRQTHCQRHRKQRKNEIVEKENESIGGDGRIEETEQTQGVISVLRMEMATLRAEVAKLRARSMRQQAQQTESAASRADEADVNGKELNSKYTSGDKEVKAADYGNEVDAVQEAMGSFGRWQLFVCLAISFVKFPVAWHQLAIVFMAPHQHYNCIVPARTNMSNQCLVNVNGNNIECVKWEFDRSIFPETIISQWNLVCSRSHYANIQQSILMFGVLLGNFIFGSLADRYGRKIPLIVSVILQLISGIGCAVVPWFPALLVLKLLSAMATGGTMVTSFVICMEIVGIKWRAAITVLYQIPYSLGHMSLAGLAFWFRHWQHLQLAITLPSIILLGYWWIIPESPRWLLAVGRQRAACEILQRAAKVNKVENKDIPEMARRHCLHQNSKRTASDHKASVLDLFRTPNMRIKSLAIFFNWIVCGMGLFGMTQYIGQVGGDIFVNFAISGATQIPGNFVSWWAMSTLGRKITLISSNTVAGIASLLLITVSPETTWLRLILACFGIVGMSVSFTTVYLFSGELFPTVVRNIGVGTSSMCARIGSMMAPFVVSLGLLQGWLPPVVFGTLPLIGAALCFFLPETAGCTLPETLQDGEDFGKKPSKSDRRKEVNAEATL